MPDLKTFWPNPGGPEAYPGLSGDGVTQSGSDPQVSVEGSDALVQRHWTNPSVPDPSGEETPNSVSGLPALPNRFEPAAEPPPPPTLQDRRPGTIDQQ